MPILQHYYTSFVDPRTGEGGFRTKAATPGLRPEVQNEVLRLIAYRIPPTADERRVETHPVALRYALLSPREAVVSCVQSCGTDENGRPGNVFAHSLVAPPGELPSHPISLWRHPAWQRDDPSERSALPELPPLTRAPGPDHPELARFLAQDGRREWLARILDVVARSGGPGGRRVVVVDDAEQVAHWIAALSLALPPSARARLTFATYHHDPYQAPYVVTGTTRDSSFRLSAQDFLQYFVVDAAQGRTSEAEPPGPFARFAARELLEGDGPDDLAPYHGFCDRRGGGALDGGLDRLTRLWLRLGLPPEEVPGSDEVELLGAALRELAETGAPTPDDLADLTLLADTVRPLLVPAGDRTLLDAYCGAAAAAGAAHRLYLRDDLDVAVALACGGRAPEAGRLLAALCRAVGADAVNALADTVETGERLAEGAGKRAGALAGAWSCFGRLRAVHRVDDPLLQATFAAVDEASRDGTDEPASVVLPLLEAIAAAAAGREAPLLRCALEWRREHGGPATEWLYYQIAGRLTLDERRAYRAVVEPEVDDIIRYEVECDLRRGRPEAARAVLGAWAEHLHGRPGEPERVVAAGVGWLWARVGGGAQPALARDILSWDELRALLGAPCEEALVRSAFADLHLRRADTAELDLLSRYADHPALPPDARTVLEIRMATTEGTLDPRSIGRIRQRLAGLPAGEYRREVTPLLARFVSPQVPVAQYANAIRAAYTREHDAEFWAAHWGALGAVVSALPTQGIAARLSFGLGRSSEADAAAEALGAWLVAFLDFWFDQALPLVVDHGYLGPRFFLSLPDALDDLQRARAWRPVARAVERQGGGAPWYPFVERWFIPRPNSSPATANPENRHG